MNYLATISRTATSSVLHLIPTTTTWKTSSSSMSDVAATPKDTPTFTTNHSATISRTMASSVLHVIPTTATWKTSSLSMGDVAALVTFHTIGLIPFERTIQHTTETIAPSPKNSSSPNDLNSRSATPSPSITSNNGVNDKRHFNKPVSVTKTIRSLSNRDGDGEGSENGIKQ